MSVKNPNPRAIAVIAIMAALVLALTNVHVWQTPAGGYIHLGDIVIFFAAFAFGPMAGAAIGGIGTALADVIGGYPMFAIASLIVHGAQGYVAGALGHSKTDRFALVLAGLAGGVAVLIGYLVAEVLFLGIPMAAAVAEVPWNTLQEALGLLGIPLYLAVRRAYPPVARYIA